MASTTSISPVEQEAIQQKFDELNASIGPILKENDAEILRSAFDLANHAHRFQRRKSGEPYIFHPIEVARICLEEIGLGPTAVTAALLHDVVEDTPVTIEEIGEAFGPKVRRIVDGLTKLDGLYNVESPQAENFKKVISSLVYDVRVVLIKMADRLHNLRTIGSMPQHKQLKIAAETSYIYSPLAHRLGLYKVKTEMQDICMKITDPDDYGSIKTKLQETKEGREAYIASFIDPLKDKMDSLGISYRILGRPKAISSIANKLRNKKIPFEKIYDLFAVRIILDVDLDKEKSFAWQVYSIITDVYKPIPERLKDWITTPKSNGYESLHTTVLGPEGRFVEVQIRSERMDEIAEKGFAAHWKYKGLKGQNNVYDAWLDNVRDILDAKHSDALEFLNDFKSNLFNEELYVFTPQGDMIILPKGATALDFAFHIHSDVGYHATAIKVNDKLVPMGHELESSDQVHVTTNKNQKPNENWLKMVVTGKARSKIRSSMKEQRRKVGEIAQEALARKLKSLKVNYDASVDFLVKHYKLQSRPDLYYAIAKEEVKLTELKKFDIVDNILCKVKVPDNASDNKPTQVEATEPTPKAKAGSSSILVNGESADQYQFSFANCCSPVQGDNIFAYLTSQEGLKIHRTKCPNAEHLMANYGYRILKAEWVTDSERNFVVDLKIMGVDSGVGVIQILSNELSHKLGVNIRSFSIEGHEGYFEGKVSVFVTNKDQLQVVMRAVEKLDSISHVSRIVNEE
jgi:GTP pyrophosphokinase